MPDCTKTIDRFEVSEMRWFSASLFFRAMHSNESIKSDIWDERIILISASSINEATERVNTYAEESEVAYQVTDTDSLCWSFVRVERIFEIQSDKLESGTEIFSRFLRSSEVESISQPFEDEA